MIQEAEISCIFLSLPLTPGTPTCSGQATVRASRKEGGLSTSLEQPQSSSLGFQHSHGQQSLERVRGCRENLNPNWLSKSPIPTGSLTGAQWEVSGSLSGTEQKCLQSSGPAEKQLMIRGAGWGAPLQWWDLSPAWLILSEHPKSGLMVTDNSKTWPRALLCSL